MRLNKAGCRGFEADKTKAKKFWVNSWRLGNASRSLVKSITSRFLCSHKSFTFVVLDCLRIFLKVNQSTFFRTLIFFTPSTPGFCCFKAAPQWLREKFHLAAPEN